MAFNCLTMLAMYLPGALGNVQVASLQAAIDRGDTRVIWGVVQANRGRPTRTSERITEVLIARIPKVNDGLRFNLIACLSQLRQHARLVVPVLADFAQNGFRLERLLAVRSLGELGPKAIGGVDAVKRCLTDDNSSELRGIACTALWQIEQQAKSVAPTIEELLSFSSSSANLDGLLALSTINATGKDLENLKKVVGPALIHLVADWDPVVRCQTYGLLPKFAPDTKVAAKVLTIALAEAVEHYTLWDRSFKQNPPRTREERLEAVSIEKDLRDEITCARNGIIALGSVAVPALLTTLRNETDPAIQCEVLAILRFLGKGATEATDDVRKLTGNSNPLVKKAAQDALKAITGK